MNKKVIALIMSTALTSVLATEITTTEQKISYSIGNQVGESLQSVNDTIKIDESILFEGISNSLQKKKSQLTEEEIADAMKALMENMNKAKEKELKEKIAKNRKESVKFLEDNSKKDGVIVTKSGLQYRVITSGEGQKPSQTDTVKVHYKGSLINGTEFDNSSKNGGPVEFPLNAVIAGWTEGLQLMPVGSKYEFVIPAELAYGDTAPPSIGPAQTLIFEVELVEIKPSKK